MDRFSVGTFYDFNTLMTSSSSGYNLDPLKAMGSTTDLDSAGGSLSTQIWRNRSLWLTNHGIASDSNNMTSANSFLMSVLITFCGTVLSVLTAGGNLMVILSIKMDKQLQTISNYFLFSLAIADLTVGCVSIPLMTLYTVQGRWSLGYVACQFWLNIDYLMSNSSVMNLLLISLDRYFSVTRPLTYRPRRTKKRAIVMMALTFVVSLLLWSPWIIAWPHIESQFTLPPDVCIIQFLVTNAYVTLGTACAAFYIPVTIMAVLYTRVYFITQRRQSEVSKMQGFRKMSHFFTASQRQRKNRRMKNLKAVKRSELDVCHGVADDPNSGIGQNLKLLMANGGTSARMCSMSTMASCDSCNSINRLKIMPPTPVANPHQPRHHCWPSVLTAKGTRLTMQPTDFHRSISVTNINLHQKPRSSSSSQSCCILHNAHNSLPKETNPEISDVDHHLRSTQEDHEVSERTISEQNISRNGTSKSRKCLRRHGTGNCGMAETDVESMSSHGPPSATSRNHANRFTASGMGEGSAGGALTVDDDCEDSEEATEKRSQLNAGLTSLLVSAFAMTFTNRLGSLTDTQTGQKALFVGGGFKKSSVAGDPKFTSRRKKTDGKAAKTLSAILLAFILTWTPYNLIVCIEAFLPNTVPLPWFTFSYYLCYLNSTVNPLCYALCSPYFRQTYIRILTCKWRKRQYRVIQLMPGFLNK